MTGNRRSRAGKGRVRAILTLLIVVAVGYTGFKLIPVRAAAFQLDDEVREQVVLAGSGRRRVLNAEIRRVIAERADSLGLPVEEREVQIERTDRHIRILVDYTVRVQFPLGYHYDWHFESSHEGPVF